MASIGHIAVGMAAARAHDPQRPPRWPSLALWSALSLLPDIDVVGFLRGVPYGAPWGHRGATHSLTLAIVGGIAVGVAARWFKRPALRLAVFASLVLASHGLLDTMTDGGLGAALRWPFSLTRYFARLWGPHGVRVNALSPGGVQGGQDPEFQAKYNARVPLGRMAEADELGGPLVFLVSDASRYVSGQELRVNGGFTA